MYIYQIVGRAKSPEDAKQLCRLFGYSLSRLVHEPGYAQGFCAINPEDQVSVLIQEQWYNQAGLQAWQRSEAYQRLHRSMHPLLEGVWETKGYTTRA